MTEDKIKSKAFQRAALNSELYRIRGLLCLFGALLLFVIIRRLATGALPLLLAQTLVLTVAIVYELLRLAIVRKALRRDRDLPSVMWVINVLVETQLPTIALFLLIESKFMSPYQALVAPAVLLYFLFIILSTLRLSPTLSFLTGLLSALGYLAVVFYTQTNYPAADAELGALPGSMYFIYAGLILAGGIVAAVVAAQIRVHVSAALREAELQRQLERVHHDLETARSIQQGLLPARSPNLDDFEIAGWNQPADQTGGDYFDWQALPDGRLAVSLGDATGHGIGPALVATSCRAYGRASFLAGGDSNGLLDRLNRLLAEDLSANRFVTFCVVFLDPANSQMEVLSAGHGPIIWFKYATGEIENLDAQGIPLGMIAGVPYGVGTKVRLAPGDMLAVVTDGFYEWENPEGEDFGMKRMEEVIRESRDCPPDEVIARLRSAVTSFSRGTAQNDDLTAVILKRKVKA
ncbi:MAG TPA: PP2C family protein-serine/threonine phosphatase [Blastocatellia bacterium]|nr:PP2C family protein-serine/threonine phosphatase [Blastocatellia bacterium]